MNALDREASTPLHLASQHGHTETASMLVALSANLAILDYDLRTPLCVAAAYGHAETASALVALGGDVAQQCVSRSGVYMRIPRSALEIARAHGDEEMVRQLLASGACAEAMIEKEKKKEDERLVVNNDSTLNRM